ncbi:MAG: hypothetical protein FJ130_00415 [Deltaproteobacteria bacterium]|nr:hypothetical protein [Deltaproteobacteria bacterium]
MLLQSTPVFQVEVGKSIEEIAEEHRSPESLSCVIGLVVCRNGEFFESFAVEFPQDISPDGIMAILQDTGIQLKTSLKLFDEEKKGE